MKVASAAARAFATSGRSWARFLQVRSPRRPVHRQQGDARSRSNAAKRTRRSSTGCNSPTALLRHIRAYARTYLDGAGKPLRSLGVSWDITTEVRSRRAARASGRGNPRRAAPPGARVPHHQRRSLGNRPRGTQALGVRRTTTRCSAIGRARVEFDTFEKLNAIVHPDDLPACVRPCTSTSPMPRTRTTWSCAC